SRTRNRRIEPSFEAFGSAEENSGFFVSEEDRVVPSTRRKKPTSGKSGGKSAGSGGGQRRKTSRTRARRGRKGGGFFGFLRGAFYWSMVLCLWGGIATAGFVAYYGAKMPAATTWSIP